jgi:hypothetical protein
LTYLSGVGAGGDGNSTTYTLFLANDWTEKLIVHATVIKNNVVRCIIYQCS